jgi:15-cis-phytoene synthase
MQTDFMRAETETITAIPRTLRGSVRRRPSNLLPALLLLPRSRLPDALLFGEWCRRVDDLADAPGIPATERRVALQRWLKVLHPGKESDLPDDLLALIRRHDLDRELFREILLGMQMDAVDGLVRINDEEGLELYCRRVASAVGLLSAKIFGARGEDVEAYSSRLGIALQLTNILRDVAEDAALGRIYIPAEDQKRFGVSEQEILSGLESPRMTHLLNHQAERADAWFAKAELAWSEMTTNQRRLMRPARLMSAVYREILLAMHRDRYDVFKKRYRVSTVRKLSLLLRVMMSGN